jgi:hypothetical protein
MRTTLALLATLSAACSLNAPVNADLVYGDGEDMPPADVERDAGVDDADAAPPDEPDASAPPVDVEVDAGYDAGPPPYYATPCDAHEQCAELAPEGTTGTCRLGPVEPGSSASEGANQCTFACGILVTDQGHAGAPDTMRWAPIHEQACWALGGVCRWIGGFEYETRCVAPD